MSLPVRTCGGGSECAARSAPCCGGAVSVRGRAGRQGPSKAGRGAIRVDWQAELRKALALQEVDRQIDVLRRERQTLLADAREVELQKAVEARRARIASLEADLAATERRQRLQELERQGQESERERSTRRLYGGEVRSARDLEGLQKNIEGNAAKISELETAILEAMERADQLKDALRDTRESLARVEEQLRRHRHAGRLRLGEIDTQLPLLATRREELSHRIEAAALREYERVRQRAHGVGVAPTSGGTCGACGLELPALVQARLRKTDQPVHCEHCGRLLVED